MNRTEAGVERVSQAEVEKGVPTIGVNYGYLWSRAPEASDAPHDEVAGEDPPHRVPPVVVRSEGEPALLAHVKAARAMTRCQTSRSNRCTNK